MFNELAANYCARCGASLAAGARFCSACGALVGAAAAGVPTIELAGAPHDLASFWRRFGALLIDGFVLALATWPMSFVFQLNIFGTMPAEPFDPEDPAAFWDWMANFYDSALGYFAVFGLVVALVQVAMESYGWTPGKAVLGMRVLREDGRRPGPVHGLARYFGKLPSAFMLYLGYLWAAWDPRRQTWHDKFAHTFVVRVPDPALGVARPAMPGGPSPLSTALGPRVWAALGVAWLVATTAGMFWLAAVVPDDGTSWQRFFEQFETPTPTPLGPRIFEAPAALPEIRLIDVRTSAPHRT